MDNRTLKERFNEKWMPEPTTGCWLWMGDHFRDGYGKIRAYDKTSRAHRVSYRIHLGEIPPGMCVCHKCDTPSCVNPDHLFLGTHKDNAHDRDAKGRAHRPRGEECGWSKLNVAKVLQIRDMYSRGFKQRQIAEIFDIYRGHVSSIVTKKRWAHI